MAEPFDQGDFKRAAFLPEITLEVYDQLPHAVDAFEPFRLRVTWEQLDDGL